MPYTPDQEKFRQLVKEDLSSVEGKRRKLKEKINARKRMYDSELPQRQYAGRANIRVPFPYTWVESMTPRYMGAIFGGSEVMDAYPRIGADFDSAQNVKNLLNFMLMFEMDFFWEAFAFFHSVSAAAIGVQKIRWENDKQTCSLHTINPLDFAMDPRVASVSKAAWVAHKVGKTKDELIAGVTGAGYIPDAVERIVEGEPDQRLNEYDGTLLPKARAVYPVWEWWGKADIGPEPQDGGIGPDGKAMPGGMIEGVRPVIAYYCKDELLCVKSSPYGDLVPFVTMADVPDPYSYYDAKSELDTMESMYEAASDIINQRIDNVTLNINGFWTYRKNSGLNLGKLVSSPWGLIGVGDHDDLKRWDTQNVTQNAYQEVGTLLDVMKLSSGLQDALRGEGQPGVKTASGMQMVLQQSGVRPGLKVQMAQYLYVKRIGEIVLKEVQMFMSSQKAISIMGGDPNKAIQSIHPDSISGEYEIMPRGFALAENKDSRLGQLNNTFNLLRGIANPNNPNDPIPQVIQLVLKEILELEDVRVPQGVLEPFAAPPPPPMDPQRQVALKNLQDAVHNQLKGGPQGAPGLPNVKGSPPTGPARPPVPAGAEHAPLPR